MRRSIFSLSAGLAVAMGCVTASTAGEITISPTSFDINGPATAMTLKNMGTMTAKMQVRAFAWSQRGGSEVFQRSGDVAVSPPFVAIEPGESATVRIVRIARRPVAEQESYRVVVDELPSAPVSKEATVQIVMRHSIPVFFSNSNAGPPKLALAASNQSGQLRLLVQNRNSGYLKLWGMSARDNRGRTVSFGDGLNGYVLGHSENTFLANGALSGSKITVQAMSNYGPVSWDTRVD